MTETKTCGVCGVEFTKRRKEPISRWANRVTCANRHCMSVGRSAARSVALTPSKVCPICGDEFSRPARQSFARWEARTVCAGASCRAAASHLNRLGQPGPENEHDGRSPFTIVENLSARGLVALSQEPEETRAWWLRQMPWHVRAHAQRMMR